MVIIHRNTPRIIKFTPHINPYATGSVLVEYGQTKVHVTAMIDEDVPPFLRGKGQGWLTAEYGMLPASGNSRIPRERKSVSGRSQEIQRMIGRSLRTAIDFSLLGERQIIIDCDVLVADGGTRTASISGGYVALVLAVSKLLQEQKITKNPLLHQVAAMSVGVSKQGEILADLNYLEDSSCETDLNLVMTKVGHFIEIQGTAEKKPFTPDQLEAMLKVGRESLQVVFAKQDEILQGVL